jgi:hypothetical protein
VTGPVVLVTADTWGGTLVRWYGDLQDAEDGNHVAVVRARELWVDLKNAEVFVADMAMNLARNELRENAAVDLSWLATHRRVDGVLCPIVRGRAA